MWERLDEGTKLKIYKQMRDKSKKKKNLVRPKKNKRDDGKIDTTRFHSFIDDNIPSVYDS
jgi:hypothetical protein